MDNPLPEEVIEFATFGRRKVAPRVCIADGKRHIRKFLGEALEELGFITCECTQVGELNAVLDGEAPDLVVLGLSAGWIEAAAMLDALGARSFDGKVLVVGPRDSLMLAAVQELGEQRGIAMLPTLAAPFFQSANDPSQISAHSVGESPKHSALSFLTVTPVRFELRCTPQHLKCGHSLKPLTETSLLVCGYLQQKCAA